MGGFLLIFGALILLGLFIQYWYLFLLAIGTFIGLAIYNQQVVVPEKIKSLKSSKLVSIKSSPQTYAIFLKVDRVKEKTNAGSQPNANSLEIEKNKIFVALPILSEDGQVTIEYKSYDLYQVEPIQPIEIRRKRTLRMMNGFAPIIKDCQSVDREIQNLDKKYLELTKLAGLISASDIYSSQLETYERGLAQIELLLRKADDLKLVYMNLLKEGLIAIKVDEFDINGISDNIQITLDARYQQAKEEYQKLKDTTTVYFDLVNEAKGKKITRSAKL